MKKEWQNIISEYMGVEPTEINSFLVSAQNRKRLYWTNIPFIGQPEDKGILLRDILENNNVETLAGRMVGRRIGADGKRKDYDLSIETKQRIEINSNPQKTNTLTTIEKDNVLVEQGVMRKPTPLECERLQTLPDLYTESISDTQRYKCIGNGWTVDVIAHILKGMLTDAN
jgi:site-specific DNA-cytosine methylase